MKIRTAIFGVYVAASALGFAVLMGFILKEVRPRYVESMRRTLADTAALLAVILEEELARVPEADLAGTWRGNPGALERASGTLRVYVTDTKGIVTFDSAGGAAVGMDYTRRPEMAAYFESNYDAGDNVDLVRGELRVTAPVRRDGSVVGLVGVARSLSSVTEAILRARLRLVAGGLAVAVLMTAAGWWIAAKLTHSLERLTAYAEAVRDGREARPPASRASEVAALAQAFEEMRVALEGKAYVERYTQALAHEVKAPLSAIRGAAELLQEELPPEERARFLGHLRSESERIQTIVERMLRLAALEARRELEDAECVALQDVVTEAIEALRPVWTTRGLDVRVDAAAGERVEARGEAFLLVQAVVNLLQNAIEFSPSGGVVMVRLETEKTGAGGRIRVVIEDQGPGVPQFARERIFERFYSLPRPFTERKSTGLGLSFVREIAGLHGGSVEVMNRAEGGARAVLTLPMA
ncbi:MAG: creC [Rariglobus sp.]|jgi:two-component system sensor histidine kinase CreC|nr:creC [Rariglobus sp.]